MVNWNTKTSRHVAYALIIGSMAIILGCSSGLQSSITKDHAQSGGLANSPGKETYASLLRQGQFTRAKILSSIYDSSSFEMKGPVLDPHVGSETVPVHQPSPLQAYLPPEQSQQTGLDGRWHTELGWSLLLGGNYEGAVAAYREALRQNRMFAEAYLGLGISLSMQNHALAAIEAYRQALDLQPDYPAALVHLGYMYADGKAEHQDVEKAKQLFHRASQQGDPFATIALLELKSR